MLYYMYAMVYYYKLNSKIFRGLQIFFICQNIHRKTHTTRIKKLI